MSYKIDHPGNEKMCKMFDSLGKINISLSSGSDIAWITSALLEIAVGNEELAADTLRLMCEHAAIIGSSEKIVRITFEKINERNKKRGLASVPEFLIPLFTVTIDHFVKEKLKQEKNNKPDETK